MKSSLGLDGLHVFITGADGVVGVQAVEEFMSQGCKITAYNLCHSHIAGCLEPRSDLLVIQGDLTDENSIQAGIATAYSYHGPIHILIVNGAISRQASASPIWKMSVNLWEQKYTANAKGAFLTIKHFLQCAETHQITSHEELRNLAIVLVEPQGKELDPVNHAGKSTHNTKVLYDLVSTVQNDMVKLNAQARINAVTFGSPELSSPMGQEQQVSEMQTEKYPVTDLKIILKAKDIGKTISFLASHSSANHINGKWIGVNNSTEVETLQVGDEDELDISFTPSTSPAMSCRGIPRSLSLPKQRKIQILLSIDFDAVSGWLGTGAHPDNSLSDYSSGIFAGQVGVPRLLKLFQKHGIADSVTWFIPGHSLESFPKETKAIVDSGAEIACHGYAHEGSSQMTEAQERDVIVHCAKLVEELTGKKPKGWRAPLYQLREHTWKVLEELGFLYDSSLTHHDSQPYFLPSAPPPRPIKFEPSTKASEWMHPLTASPAPSAKTLVELPCNWYMEDMTPMQYWPHTPNSNGYVPASVIEAMWKDRFEFLYNEDADDEDEGTGYPRTAEDDAIPSLPNYNMNAHANGLWRGKDFLFPLVLHPDTSGMAHIVGMIDRMIGWLKSRGNEVQFVKYGECADEWKSRQSA